MMAQLRAVKNVPFYLFTLKSSTWLRSIITEVDTYLLFFCALFRGKKMNSMKTSLIDMPSAYACAWLCGSCRSGENSSAVLSGGTDAPDITLNRNNCQLTPCRLPRAGLDSTSLFDIE